MSSSPDVLAITKWLVWPVRAAANPDTDRVPDEAPRASIIQPEQVHEAAVRIAGASDASAKSAQRSLVRFNVQNLGDAAVTVCGVALTTTDGHTLRCTFAPIAISPDEHFPLMLEVAGGLLGTITEFLLESTGALRRWVAATRIPNPE